MLGDRRFHVLLVAQHSQLFEQLALLAVEFGGSEHVDMDVQVTAAGALQPGSTQATKRLDVAALGTRPDVDFLLAVEGLQRDHRPQRGRRHRDAQLHVQVVALAFEDGMRLLDDLHVRHRPDRCPGPPHLVPTATAGAGLHPGGTSTLIVCRVRTRPSPAHSGRGRD